MDELSEWKCCHSITCNHDLQTQHPAALELLKNICEREGCRDHFFSNEKAWNIDLVESLRAKRESRNRRKTMDCFFAIKLGKIVKMKIVDFKSRTKSKVPKVDKAEIEEKINYSKQIIGHQYAVHSLPVLIYPIDRIQQAKNMVSRTFARKNVVEVKTIHDLKTYF